MHCYAKEIIVLLGAASPYWHHNGHCLVLNVFPIKPEFKDLGVKFVATQNLFIPFLVIIDRTNTI